MPGLITGGPRRVDRTGAWLNSWRLAFRIGGREIRRAPGRSILIMIMVGLPVLLIIAAVTWAHGTTSTAMLREVMGNAQALIQMQPASDQHRPGDRLGRLIDGRLLPLTAGDVGLELGTPIHVPAVALPVDGMADTGLLELRSGHWPTADDQVLITKEFAGRHQLRPGAVLPAFAVQPAGDPRPTDLHIVGIAALPKIGGPSADLVLGRQQLITVNDPSQVQYLLLRPDPVQGDAVRRLQQHGFQVTSRYLVEHPELDPDAAGRSAYGFSGSPDDLAFYVLLGAGLLFESMLLAGPAFAISAARQRHTMGLIASNGALRTQLRRQLLGQALILGMLAGAIGVVLGILAGRYAEVLLARLTGSWAPAYPVSWPAAGIALLGAAVAAVVAALLPARGVGRLELVAVLRRRTTAARTRTLTPVIGLMMFVAGTGVVVGFGFFGAAKMGPRYLMGAGTAAAFVGAMLVLPWLVTGLGRIAAGLPVSIRLAGRDAARQLGRTVPAMAAVLVASGMFTIMGISLASDDLVQQQQYQPQTAIGQGTVSPAPDAAVTINVIRGRHPEWKVTGRPVLGGQIDPMTPGPTVAIVPSGCTPGQAVTAGTGTDGQTDLRCAEGRSDDGATVQVVPDDQLGSIGLPAAARELLGRGGLALVMPRLGYSGDPARWIGTQLITAGHATVVAGIRHGKAYRSGSPSTLPAMVIDRRQFTGTLRAQDDGTIGWIAAHTADQAKLPTSVEAWDVSAPGTAIPAAEQQTINELAATDAPLYVERGYQSATQGPRLVLLGLGSALVIIAALVATALSQVEARPDLATLAAVGAPPGLRRRFAAAQAAIIVLVGVIIGQLVGLTAGVAFAASNTREYSGGGPMAPTGPAVIVVPWEQPVLLLVGAMAVAGVLAVFGAWSSPSVSRRLG